MRVKKSGSALRLDAPAHAANASSEANGPYGSHVQCASPARESSAYSSGAWSALSGTQDTLVPVSVRRTGLGGGAHPDGSGAR